MPGYGLSVPVPIPLLHEEVEAMLEALTKRPRGKGMIYAATISSTSLRVRESRLIAGLLIKGVSTTEWRNAVEEQNVLQIGSVVTAIRCARIIRARLEPLGEGLWKMVRDGDKVLATQAAFAGAVKHSRLLGDFMDLTIREQRTLFAEKLENHMWTEFVAGCRGRDPDMPHWSDTTIVKLRSVVFSMLAEAGYLKDTRSRQLQNVFLDRELSSYLADKGETYVLRCMELTE
ncbi:MAG: DUF1819 family protein [Planctomycetes bacterium]|nr:DUF1819 family protein [Planctomycetota bacterium]